MWRVSTVAKKLLTDHPIVSNSIIYGTLCVGAEFSQQTISKKISIVDSPNVITYDYRTLSIYGILGSAVFAPLFYHWYRWLDKKFVGNSTRMITKKLLLDQFLMTPQLLVIFYVAMSVMENKMNYLEECQQKFVPTFKNSCLFWLPAQAVNFLFVPSAFRVMYVGICSFAWVNILCWIKRQEY